MLPVLLPLSFIVVAVYKLRFSITFLPVLVPLTTVYIPVFIYVAALALTIIIHEVAFIVRP